MLFFPRSHTVHTCHHIIFLYCSRGDMHYRSVIHSSQFHSFCLSSFTFLVFSLPLCHPTRSEEEVSISLHFSFVLRDSMSISLPQILISLSILPVAFLMFHTVFTSIYFANSHKAISTSRHSELLSCTTV